MLACSSRTAMLIMNEVHDIMNISENEYTNPSLGILIVR